MATASGITDPDQQLSVQIDGLGEVVDAVILNNSPCCVVAGKLCMEKGFGFEWKPNEQPKLVMPDGSFQILRVDQYVPLLASLVVGRHRSRCRGEFYLCPGVNCPAHPVWTRRDYRAPDVCA